MGRIIKTLLSLSICLSLVVSIPVFAADDQEKTYDTVNVESVSIDDFDYVSEILTYDEMIQRYADNANISFEEALKFFPKTRMASPRATYRELQVTLNVATNYKPKLAFYCETSQSSQYWGIVSIYSVQLIRSYNGISKQFSGYVNAWLRTAAQVEYVVNGDFYNNGTTSGGFSVGGQGKVNDKITGTFTASLSTSSNHFKYFYDHVFHNFQ